MEKQNKALVVVCILSVGFVLGSIINPRTILRREVEAVEKPYDRRDVVAEYFLGELEKCESSQRPSLRILDSNNKFSYGSLMFQEDTFTGYGKKYKIIPDDLAKGEFENLIYDRDIQMQVAKAMLLNEREAWRNWYHCANDIGLSKVDFIGGF